MTHFNLQTSGNTLILILAAVLAIALSYFVYRKTIPPVSSPWRFLLTTLRALSVILIVFLLFEPILSVTRKHSRSPIVAVLIDNSASMGLKDEKVDRPVALINALSAPQFTEPSNDYTLRFFTFSSALTDELDAAPDSLALTGDGTDIQNALEGLKQVLAEDYFAAAVLITDGADNLGENPARYASGYGVPIYPIGIGDPSEQKDILITNYVTNEVAYAGTEVPVDVYIKSSGFAGQRIAVNLLHGNKTLNSQFVTLTGSGMEQKVRLTFTPEQQGLTKYELQIPQLEDELTQVNNTKTFYTKVLKSKLKVMMIAGAPGPDFSFMKRVLASDKNFDITVFVERKNGAFYQAATLPTLTDLEQIDCFILLGYPTRTSNKAAIGKLRSVFAKGKPVLFVPGKNPDFDKLWALKDSLPFDRKPARTAEKYVYPKILPQGAQHPLMRSSEDDLENAGLWHELPPIFVNVRALKLRQGAMSLASVDIARSQTARSPALPLLVAYNSGNRKSVTVMAYGLWRWDLLMWGVSKTNRVYDGFVRNTVRWLTTQEDSKLVRVTAHKEIYRSGEQVNFTAQVYFEDYRPVDGAEVVVQLTGGKDVQELTLRNLGDGRYEGSFRVLNGGDYQFTGTAHLQGRVLGRDSGRFSVEAFNLEYQNTRMNEDLLKRIAAESGGAFYTPNDLLNLENELHFQPKYLTSTNEWEIWNRWPVLLTCILLLSAEWFIRKRKGML